MGNWENGWEHGDEAMTFLGHTCSITQPGSLWCCAVGSLCVCADFAQFRTCSFRKRSLSEMPVS